MKPSTCQIPVPKTEPSRIEECGKPATVVRDGVEICTEHALKAEEEKRRRG